MSLDLDAIHCGYDNIRVLGNNAQVLVSSIAAASGQLKAGKLKALATTAAQRSALLPSVPTLAEAGVKGVDVYSWQAIAAPRGLPADLKAKLHAALVAAINDPSVKDKLVSQGFEIVANTPEEFTRFQAAEYARWKKVIETGGIKAD